MNTNAQEILEHGKLIGLRGDLLIVRFETHLYHLWFVLDEWQAVCVQ